VNPFQTIERRDVGLTLRVKPQISEGGVVRMAIFQEDSAVRTTGPAGPTTSKRAVETNVLVDDRDILILGGLIRDTADSGVDKVPLLGDIPVIGSLFRYDKRERRKTNLLIFIRPTVIRDANSARSVVADRYEEIRALQRESNPNTNILLPGVGQAAIPELPAVRIPPTVIPAPAGGTAPPAPATPGSAPSEPPKQ
jgi:general secretion pathway protein D